MISGETKTESTYRATMLDSSSSLKDFAKNRKAYFKKYYLNEEIEEDDNKATIMGKLVETILLEPELFDSKFHLSACATSPTGLMLAFVEALYKYTVEATTENGIVAREFNDRAQDAYNASGYKIKYAEVIKKFAGSDAEIYFNEILKVRTKHLIVVTTQDIINAERIVADLKSSFVTSAIVNLESSPTTEVINQLQIEGYNIGNLMFKSMMDKVIIDHDKKMITPYDLKCTWAVENFFEDYYLYRKGYIQAFVYHIAIQYYRNKYLPGYSISPIRFIVCDSTSYYSPLIYALTYEDLKEARDGFMYKNKFYQGVAGLVKDLEWAQTENIWNLSRENYEAKGFIPLKPIKPNTI